MKKQIIERDFILKKMISELGWQRENWDLPLKDEEVLTQTVRLLNHKNQLFTIDEIKLRVGDIRDIMEKTNYHQGLVIKNWWS